MDKIMSSDMKDQEIKDLFKADHSSPQRPAQEWSQIQQTIQGSEQSPSIFDLFTGMKYPIGALSIFLIIFFTVTLDQRSISESEKIDIAHFMFEDNYFNSDESIL